MKDAIYSSEMNHCLINYFTQLHNQKYNFVKMEICPFRMNFFPQIFQVLANPADQPFDLRDPIGTCMLIKHLRDLRENF